MSTDYYVSQKKLEGTGQFLPPPQHQSQVLGHHTSDKLAINQDFLLSYNSLDNLIEWFTELIKALYLWLPVYYKGHNSGAAKWKRSVEQSIGEGHHAVSEHTTFSAPQGDHLPGSSSNLVQKFMLMR